MVPNSGNRLGPIRGNRAGNVAVAVVAVAAETVNAVPPKVMDGLVAHALGDAVAQKPVPFRLMPDGVPAEV